MLDKILRVNANLVILYYVNRAPLRVTSDNGTALELALAVLDDVAHFSDDALEATIVIPAKAA
ncbi:MAG: hypothetical protein NVS1B10_05790 [Candidatus Saccharimonadales bacterium]